MPEPYFGAKRVLTRAEWYTLHAVHVSIPTYHFWAPYVDVPNSVSFISKFQNLARKDSPQGRTLFGSGIIYIITLYRSLRAEVLLQSRDRTGERGTKLSTMPPKTNYISFYTQ